MALTINAGATAADIELGGLSLVGLTISQGASDFDLAFSETNQTEMSTLRFNAGASKATLTSLANAKAAEVIFKGGAGDYTLDFSGDLQRDVRVSVEAGLGNVVIIVPENIAAEATFDGALTNVDTHDAWQRSANKYVLEGESHRIVFEVNMGVGNLELHNR